MARAIKQMSRCFRYLHCDLKIVNKKFTRGLSIHRFETGTDINTVMILNVML